MHPASAKMTAKKDDGICSWGQLAGFIHADNGNPIIKMPVSGIEIIVHSYSQNF